MNNIRPGAIAILVGGLLVLVSTFLDWFGGFRSGSGFNAYSSDIFGFTGIFLLLLSLAVIAITAIQAFAPQVSLPGDVLGFTMNELVLLGGFASFVWGLSIAFVDGSKGGTLLCAVGGIAVVVGAILEQEIEPAEPTRAI